MKLKRYIAGYDFPVRKWSRRKTITALTVSILVVWTVIVCSTIDPANTKVITLSSTAVTDAPKLETGATTMEEWRTVRMRVTAYCPCDYCCGDWADGITANGHVIKQGDRFVAADRRYSFGTKLLIPGYNSSQIVKVFDRGGAIKNNRLDVFFNTHQEALEWGVQHLDVKVFVQ